MHAAESAFVAQLGRKLIFVDFDRQILERTQGISKGIALLGNPDTRENFLSNRAKQQGVLTDDQPTKLIDVVLLRFRSFCASKCE